MAALRWRGFDFVAKEEKDLFEIVSPKFGRFTAFDPRLPHGVRQVTRARLCSQYYKGNEEKVVRA